MPTYPFAQVENNTVQVLLQEFELHRIKSRDSTGIGLTFSFDSGTPSIRRREEKDELERDMRARIGEEYGDLIESIQSDIDGVTFRGNNDYSFFHDEFRFRYCSGGTLPVVRIGDDDFYCLFLRDKKPFGWNIANGATDTFAELIDPRIAIRRELREEIVVVDPIDRVDYTFFWDGRNTIHRPEFDEARALIARNFEHLRELHSFRKFDCIVTEAEGPDHIQLTFDSTQKPVVTGGYLNINAKDYGIEYDQIASILVQETDILIDGEINDNKLLNRPIGLFPAIGFDIENPGDPEIVFWSGRKMNLYEAVEGFSSWLLTHSFRDERHIQMWHGLDPKERFGLCPVTHQIIRRHQYEGGRLPAFVPEQRVMAYMLNLCAKTRQIYRDLRSTDWGIDGEIEWVDDAGLPTGKRIYLQLKHGASHVKPLKNTERFRIDKRRHIDYWLGHPADVYVVISNRDCVEWMNISESLEEDKTQNVDWKGKELTEQSLLRVRNAALAKHN